MRELWALLVRSAAYELAHPAGGHMSEFLAMARPSFSSLPAGFTIGLVKSFLYGALERTGLRADLYSSSPSETEDEEGDRHP